ncbi:MAG: tetratricopeptide repeat protein, partial [Chloroflexota bacterium]|nr:tetratricopeptide repeat protein [Chloroflexota bacterium]
MTDHAQNRGHSNSLADLSALLEQYATGTGRITPRPRGARLSEEIRATLEDAVAALENTFGELVSPEELFIFGNGCYAIGRHADASEAYMSILADEPSNADARFNLGLAYLRLRSPQDAVREFTDLLVQQPLLAEAFYQRGNGNDDLGQTDRAIADYGRAIELEPEYVHAMFNRGILLAQTGRHQEAVA